MKRRQFTQVLLLALWVSISGSALAKQPIVKIEIRGEVLLAPIEITDERVVSRFNVWNGPGTRSWDGEGQLNPPAHLDPNKPEGRFVDWPKGIANERPANQSSFEVTFYLGHGENQRRYLFTYAMDVPGHPGFIYLPAASRAVIYHGVEENWFHASETWDELISPLIAAAIE